MFLSHHSTTSPPGGTTQGGAYAFNSVVVHRLPVPRVVIAPAYVHAYGPVHVCRTRRPARACNAAPGVDPTRIALVLGCLVFWCFVAVACFS